jgi:HSF-type DNA-binding
MTRQKVNGNGIRAAGNPDEEPTLANYPSCPPTLGESSCNSSVSQNESEDADNRERPYSRLIQSVPNNQTARPSPSFAEEVEAAQKEASTVSDENMSHDGKRMSKKGGSLRIAKDDSTASQASFPLKLQRILDKAHEQMRTDIISWLPHGKAFLVHDVDRFVSEVMPIYFNQTKYSSFQRQVCYLLCVRQSQ